MDSFHARVLRDDDDSEWLRNFMSERSGLRKIHMPKISILALCCCVRFTRGSDVSKYMGCFGNVSKTDVCIHMIYMFVKNGYMFDVLYLYMTEVDRQTPEQFR
ncbi:hypothetical protein QTP88_026890 [Uroleucon formosanum]